jgi:hypothetical protein
LKAATCSAARWLIGSLLISAPVIHGHAVWAD